MLKSLVLILTPMKPILILFKGFKAALNIYFILVNPYLFRELKSVQDIIEMIKKDNCISISDDYDSHDEDCILDIDIRRDFLLKDAIREGKKTKFLPNKIIRVCPCTQHQCYAEVFFIRSTLLVNKRLTLEDPDVNSGGY